MDRRMDGWKDGRTDGRRIGHEDSVSAGHLVALARGEPRLVVPFLQRGVAVRLEGGKSLCHELWMLRRLQLPLGGTASTRGPPVFLAAVFLAFAFVAIDLFVFL